MSGAEVELRSVGFSHGPHTVLADVTATVGPRSRLAVVGPNGVGKSTLLAPARRRPDTRDRTGHARARRPRRSSCCRRSATGGPGRRCGSTWPGVPASPPRTPSCTRPRTGSRPGPTARTTSYAAALDRWLALGGADLDGRAAAVLDRLGLAEAAARPRDHHLLRRPAGPVRPGRRAAHPGRRPAARRADQRPRRRRAGAARVVPRGPRRRAGRRLARPRLPRAGRDRRCSRSTSSPARARCSAAASRPTSRSASGPGPPRRRPTRPTTSSAARWSTGPAGRRSGPGRARPGRPARRRGPTSRTRTSAPPSWRVRSRAAPPPAGWCASSTGSSRSTTRATRGSCGWRSTRPPAGRTTSPGSRPRWSTAATSRLGPVDLAVRRGERVAVTGPNGSGKSTLLAALLGRLPLSSGRSWLGPQRGGRRGRPGAPDLRPGRRPPGGGVPRRDRSGRGRGAHPAREVRPRRRRRAAPGRRPCRRASAPGPTWRC